MYLIFENTNIKHIVLNIPTMEDTIKVFRLHKRNNDVFLLSAESAFYFELTHLRGQMCKHSSSRYTPIDKEPTVKPFQLLTTKSTPIVTCRLREQFWSSILLPN